MKVDIPIYLDNTMISSFRTCPRKFYFRHVRNWRSSGTALPLVFGSSWHEAMDVIWSLSGKDFEPPQLHQFALAAFQQKWSDEGLNVQMTIAENEQAAPRTPGIGSEMIWNYINHRMPFLKSIELIECEKPFMVSFSDPGLPKYIGRIDKVFRDEVGNIKLGEHKTTSLYAKSGGVQQRYMDTYSPNSQVDGYMFASQRELNLNAVGVYVDIALVHKTHHDIFKFLPVTRNQPAINNWETETINWIDIMMSEFHAYDRLDEGQPMHCFPRNTDSCFDFFSQCPYADICRFKDRPQALEETPDWLVEEKWEPFEVLGFEKEKEEEEEK